MCDSSGNFKENELLQLLAEVRRIIDVSRCQYNSLQDDLNLILNYPRQEGQSKIASVSHTYCQLVENVARDSLVEHFIFNKNRYEAIIESGSVQSVDNFSWHDPTYFKLILGMLNT